MILQSCDDDDEQKIEERRYVDLYWSKISFSSAHKCQIY